MKKYLFGMIIALVPSIVFGGQVDIEFKNYKEAINALKKRGVILEKVEYWFVGAEEFENSNYIWILNGDKENPSYRSFAKIKIYLEDGKVSSDYAVQCNAKNICRQFTQEIEEMVNEFIK